MTARRIPGPDGLSVAAYEAGGPAAATIVAIHGYPDNHTVWDGVVACLVDRFHVVTYDVRGTGASDVPSARSGYRMPHLVADLAAVVDAVSPDAPVHLLAHDWGSIQAWAAVADPSLAGRIATFTSISGPALDQAGAWLRQLPRRPRAVLRQLAHSSYIALFQLPRLPEVAIRGGVLDRATRTDTGLRSPADLINGLELYRANMRARPRRPRRIDVPVQVIVPLRDPFVTPALAAEAPAPWVPDLTVHRIPGGHWVIGDQPALIARLTGEFAATVRARV